MHYERRESSPSEIDITPSELHPSLHRARQQRKIDIIQNEPIVETGDSDEKRNKRYVDTFFEVFELSLCESYGESDIVGETIDDVADGMAKTERITSSKMRDKLRALLDTKPSKQRISEMIESAYSKKFALIKPVVREVGGLPEDQQEIEEHLYDLATIASKQGLSQDWVKNKIHETRKEWVAEYRSADRQWDILKKTLEKGDVNKLKSIMKEPNLLVFMKRGMDILPDMNYLTQQEAKKAWTILFLDSLRARITTMIDRVDSSELQFQDLQRQQAREKALFNAQDREMRAPSREEYNRKMGEMSKQIPKLQKEFNGLRAVFTTMLPEKFIELMQKVYTAYGATQREIDDDWGVVYREALKRSVQFDNTYSYRRGEKPIHYKWFKSRGQR